MLRGRAWRVREILSPVNDYQEPSGPQDPCGFNQDCRVVVQLVPNVGHEDDVATLHGKRRTRGISLDQFHIRRVPESIEFVPDLLQHFSLEIDGIHPANLAYDARDGDAEIPCPCSDVGDNSPILKGDLRQHFIRPQPLESFRLIKQMRLAGMKCTFVHLVGWDAILGG